MKKIFCLLAFLLALGLVSGQQVVNGVLQGSPSSFMFLTPQTGNPNNDQWSASWVKPSSAYDGEFDSQITQGAILTGDFSHRFITTTNPAQSPANDPCFRNSYSPYNNKPILAESWNSDIYPGTYVDTVIQMGGPDNITNRGLHAQEILYSFVPDTNNPVLLLQFAFSTEGVYHSDNFAPRNPGVEFALLAHGTNNFLNLGHYPQQPGEQLHPYSQFWFGTPKGNSSGEIPGVPSETVPMHEDPRNTPVPEAYAPQAIPKGSCHCQSGITDVYTFPYTRVAFDLSEQARNGQAVDLRIREWACDARFHWADCYFTAKMIPAKLKVKYCGGDTLQLQVPWGFGSYQWFNGADAESATYFDPNYDEENGITIEGSNVYRPILKPDPRKPYFRCEVVSQTGVPFTYEAMVNYYLLKPAFQATPRAISDSVRKCDYSVVLHNQSLIGIIGPDSIVPGKLDTLWQDLRGNPEQCTWDFGDGTPVVHGFQPEHTYADTGTYIIKLHIQDYERICTSYDTTDTVRIMIDYKMVTDTLKDMVVTCESKLPYYYKPIRFGYDNVTTKWDKNAEGERLVNFTLGLPDTLKAVDGRDSIVHVRSWNGCDSIARVKFQILTPWVNIQQDGDFCDSAKVTLLSNVGNVDEESVGYKWSFMGVHNEEDTLSDFMAISDGVYVVNIIDKSTECEASATYKIDPCVPNVFLPNCITPTSTQFDGPVQNDYFYLDQFVLRFITDIKFMVYSRNGEQLFYYEGTKDLDGNFMPPTPFAKPDEMLDRLVLWDGKVKGEVIRGTYVYTLWIVSGGQTYMYKGKLTVM